MYIAVAYNQITTDAYLGRSLYLALTRAWVYQHPCDFLYSHSVTGPGTKRGRDSGQPTPIWPARDLLYTPGIHARL